MAYECSTAGDGGGFKGCGRRFGGLRDFDRHFVQVTHADDPTRDRGTVSITGERCATDEELRAAGLEPNDSGVWRDLVEAERARVSFGR